MERRKIIAIKTQFTYSKKGSSFDPKAASLYSASIHADRFSITLGVSNPVTGEVIDLNQLNIPENNTESIVNLIEKNAQFFNTLKNATRTTFYPVTKNTSLIPSTFFDKNNFHELAANISDLQEGESWMYSFIPEIDSYLIFPFRKEMEQQLQSIFGHVSIRHHFASLISTYKLYYVKKGSKSVFIQFHDHIFSLCLFSDDSIVHFNTFDMLSFEDVIYYTYYTMNQFDFDVKNAHLFLGGSFGQLDKTLHAFQRYSPSIFQLKPNCCDELSPQQANALINTIFDIQCG